MYIDPGQKQILVVDDDEFIRDLLTSWLEFRGYQVKCAKNGREALQLRQQTHFDLILLDIKMPEMNGYEVLKQLRADNNTTPVVVMSALSDANSVVACIKLGAEDYLSKPIESELLWARITASLEKQHYQDMQQAWLEDLNLLEQIDQELNTTLDRTAVSELTLHWTAQKTDAVTSLIGSVDGNLLKLRAALGFDGQVNQSIALSALGIDKNQEKITQKPLSENGRLHPQASYRITIPINRNTVIKDIIIVDTAKPVPDTAMRFLKRLSTHIAIALHNAQLYADVQAANQAKSNFVATVSHELKNPLTAIQSYTYMLQRQIHNMTAEKQKEYLKFIHEGAERIHNLALELDDITQIETGQFRLTVEDVSFQTILDDVLTLMEPQIAARQQTMQLDLPQKLPLVQADAKRLSQIMVNLISNACKYTPDAGQIDISARHITNGASPMLYVAVKDNGIGITPENQAHVFRQFFRADDTQVKNVRGTGLGLNITKKLVELQGGEIGFNSEYTQGSTFFFTIPVNELETAVLAGAAPVT
jgi:signal transduction histidine kinase/AmiR/NasT family two-component response regulator